MGFQFTKVEDNRKVLMEKQAVSLKRIEYLDKKRKYREAGKNIIYMDESYIHTSHTKGKTYIDEKRSKKADFKRSTINNNSCRKRKSF